MVFSPSQKQICEYECDTEGRHKSCPLKCKKIKESTSDSTNHRFLIISKSEYNQQSHYISGFPITSKTNHLIENYPLAAWTVDPDLISNSKPPFTRNTIEKGTKVLCDRPCRISKECILASSPDSFGQLSDRGYALVMQKFLNFCSTKGVVIDIK